VSAGGAHWPQTGGAHRPQIRASIIATDDHRHRRPAGAYSWPTHRLQTRHARPAAFRITTSRTTPNHALTIAWRGRIKSKIAKITSPPAVPYRATLFGRYLPYRVPLRPSAVHVDGRKSDAAVLPSELHRTRPRATPFLACGGHAIAPAASAHTPERKVLLLPAAPSLSADCLRLACPDGGASRPAPEHRPSTHGCRVRGAGSLARSPSHKDRAELPLSRTPRPGQAAARICPHTA
jgi:hypothetical protein